MAGRLISSKPSSKPGSKAEVAYLAPWGSAAARFLAAGLQDGLRIATTNKAVKVNEGPLGSGTPLIHLKDKEAERQGKAGPLAKSSGAEVGAAGTGWEDEGG